MVDRQHEAHTAFVMRAPLAALVIVPIAAVSATSTGSPPAVLAAIAALSVLTWVAVRLLVMESLAEERSRAEWDAIGTPIAMMHPRKPDDLGPQYPATVHDEALHAVLRTHRQEYPRQGIELAGEIGKGNDRAPQDKVAVTTRVPPTLPAREEAGSCIAEPGRLQNDANDMHTGLAAVRSCAPMKSANRGKRILDGSARLETRFRRVVNASADSPGRGAKLRVIGIPIKIVSDIVVLGQSKKEPINSEGCRKAQLDGASEAQLTASHRIRLRRSPNTTVDGAAIAEARRKVIALAEALAPQAAREDDAAEQARERSSAAADVATPGNPSSDGNEETG